MKNTIEDKVISVILKDSDELKKPPNSKILSFNVSPNSFSHTTVLNQVFEIPTFQMITSHIVFEITFYCSYLLYRTLLENEDLM